MITPPRTYAPIFGTAGSSPRWKWYGRDGAQFLRDAQPDQQRADSAIPHLFRRRRDRGPGAYADYDDATVTLTWTVDPVIVGEARSRRRPRHQLPPMIHVDIFYDYECQPDAGDARHQLRHAQAAAAAARATRSIPAPITPCSTAKPTTSNTPGIRAASSRPRREPRSGSSA